MLYLLPLLLPLPLLLLLLLLLPLLLLLLLRLQRLGFPRVLLRQQLQARADLLQARGELAEPCCRLAAAGRL